MKKQLVARNLGKAFRRYASPRHRLYEWLTLGKYCQHHTKWVLRNLDFTIEQGEAVGIVGRNGAGKSTLLKMMTGVLQPSEGHISRSENISALLELGMGFHGDFTGRQNIYMACQLYGMQKIEIDDLISEVIAFAEIGDYIELPVKTYSSGMLVRLAFSVATAKKPDILIVDEALAVGDAYFQHKCYKRIREYKEQGVTLLFVSHDPLAIKSLCNRAILLEHGALAMDGPPDQVLDYYNALIALDGDTQDNPAAHIQQDNRSVRSGNGDATITQVDLLVNEQSSRKCETGDNIAINVNMQINVDLASITLGFLIKDRLGNEIFGSNTHHLGLNLSHLKKEDLWQCIITLPHIALGPGSYSISIALHSSSQHLDGNYDWWDRAIVFEVYPSNNLVFTGAVNLPVNIQSQKI